MSEPAEFEELLVHLVRTSRLSRAEAMHLVDEVLSFLNEQPEDFVCRRHRVLQSRGLPNEQIFSACRPNCGAGGFARPITASGNSGA